jgi:Secretion system C-terminal sorting domain
MKKKYFFFLFFTATFAIAQNSCQLNWGTYLGLGGNKIILDNQGNVYKYGTIDYDYTKPTNYYSSFTTTGAHQANINTANGNYNVGMISKFSSQGNLLWSTFLYTVSTVGDFNSEILEIKIDANNDVIVTGNTLNSQDYTSATSGIITIAPLPNLNTNRFTAKFSSTGQYLWGQYIIQPQPFGYNEQSIYDNAGNRYVTGRTSTEGLATAGAFDPNYNTNLNSTFGQNTYIAKYDGNNNLLWFTYYGICWDLYNYNNVLAVDAQDNLYFIGANMNFKNQQGNPHNYYATTGCFANEDNANSSYYSQSVVLSKFSPTGQRLWSTYYGVPNQEGYTGGLMVVNNNAIYISGTTTVTNNIATTDSYQPVKQGGVPTTNSEFYYFEPNVSAQQFYNDSFFDGFIAKFDLDGNRLWGTYYGGEHNEGINKMIVKNDKIYIAGTTYSTTGIATSGSFKETITPGSTIITNPNYPDEIIYNKQDAFITQLNSDGTRNWATYYGGDRYENVFNIIIDDNNAIYCEGTTTSQSGLTTTNSYLPNYNTLEYNDYFLTKFVEVSLSTNQNEITDNSINIYPNPTTSIININLPAGSQEANFNIKSVQLFDIQGLVLTTQLVEGNQAILDVSTYSNGVYFVKVSSDKGVKLEKIIKEN